MRVTILEKATFPNKDLILHYDLGALFDKRDDVDLRSATLVIERSLGPYVSIFGAI